MRLRLIFCLRIFVRVLFLLSYFISFLPFCGFFLYHIITLSIENMFSDRIVFLVFAWSVHIWLHYFSLKWLVNGNTIHQCKSWRTQSVKGLGFHIPLFNSLLVLCAYLRVNNYKPVSGVGTKHLQSTLKLPFFSSFLTSSLASLYSSFSYSVSSLLPFNWSGDRGTCLKGSDA